MQLVVVGGAGGAGVIVVVALIGVTWLSQLSCSVMVSGVCTYKCNNIVQPTLISTPTSSIKTHQNAFYSSRVFSFALSGRFFLLYSVHFAVTSCLRTFEFLLLAHIFGVICMNRIICIRCVQLPMHE